MQNRLNRMHHSVLSSAVKGFAKRRNDEGFHVQAADGHFDHSSHMLPFVGSTASAQVRRPGFPAFQGAERRREPSARCRRQFRDRAEVRARAGTQGGRWRSPGEGGAVRDRLEGDQALQSRHRPQGVREGGPEQSEDADRRDAQHRLQAQDHGLHSITIQTGQRVAVPGHPRWSRRASPMPSCCTSSTI